MYVLIVMTSDYCILDIYIYSIYSHYNYSYMCWHPLKKNLGCASERR
jgi:hypothetical protein